MPTPFVYNRLIIPQRRPAKQVRMTHFETHGVLPEIDSTESSKANCVKTVRLLEAASTEDRSCQEVARRRRYVVRHA